MYVWLGLPNPSFQSRDPFEMVMHWANDNHFYQYPGFSLLTDTGKWVFHDNAIYQEMYEMFADFVSRPWWTRLWCVQEIALCPRATMVLGTWRIPWATVLSAKNNHYRHAAECCLGIGSLIPTKYTYFSDHMLYLSQRVGLLQMDHVIRSLRHKLCKDPRDKIYGLLGLLWEDPAAKLRPDYSLPVSKVYLQATEAIIAQSKGGLQFLTGSGFGSDCYQLPSWVRNFAAPLDAIEASHEYSRHRRYNYYYAGARTRSETRILEGNILSLSGMFVDRIERISSPIQDRGWTHELDTIQSWADIAEISTLDQAYGYASSQECFWRTILADCIPAADSGSATWNRVTTPTGVSISAWFVNARYCLQQKRDPHTTAPVYAMWAATYGRAFFRTEKGHFGLCFPHMRTGDEVWVLAGGQVPFVLRRLNDAYHSVEEYKEAPQMLKLIGECYLHGFMDGEALDAHDDIMVPVHLT